MTSPAINSRSGSPVPWRAERQTVGEGCGETIAVASGARRLSVGETLEAWRRNEAFRDFFIETLAQSPYGGFFWELPQLESRRLGEPFECAAVRGDELTKVQADDSDFAEYLNAADSSVAAFRNLGHDALLIAPKRISDADCYGHIAAFVRKAPREQQHALFQLTGAEAEKLLALGHRFWISTSGLGVPWLHVRLDTDPKYYQYRPYAEG